MQGNFTLTDWVKGSNIYEVNTRQFTPQGTFKAFAAHLPRLKSMGVDVLWFMPVTPISKTKRIGSLGSYYACSHYNQINPEFGTLADFKQVVAGAQQLGFKVLLDWVGNHTGWDHNWTTEHPEYYDRDTNGNFFDAHGWSDVIDLDYGNENLRKAMLAAMKFWIEECDIDGYRCDMAHLVPLDFWITARTELDKVKPDLFWLAETEDTAYHLAFDCTYGWELLHTMEHLYKGNAGTTTLETVLHKYADRFANNSLHLAFTSNHDENSHSGSEYERLGDSAKAFAVLTATWANCLPLVYSGQELPNKKRLQFFNKDEIDWTGNNWLHNFYETLLTTRCKHVALHGHNTASNTTIIKTSANDKVFAFTRQAPGDEVLVLLHLSHTPLIVFTIEAGTLSGNYTSIFSGLHYQLTGALRFEMKAWDYLVYTKNN